MQNLLLKSPPFSVLSPYELDKLTRYCQEMSCRKGHTIFREGQPASWVWVIRSGWLRLSKKSCAEKSVTIDLLTPREAICGISVFDHRPYSATATAATDCSVVRIPSEQVLALLRSNPDFGQRLLSICCNRIRHMAESCAMLYEPAPRRIAKALLHLKEVFGPVLPVTHAEIAGITGMRVETTIRMMAGLKKRGWLNMTRGRIRLLQPEQLRTLLKNSEEKKPEWHDGGHKGYRSGTRKLAVS